MASNVQQQYQQRRRTQQKLQRHSQQQQLQKCFKNKRYQLQGCDSFKKLNHHHRHQCWTQQKQLSQQNDDDDVDGENDDDSIDMFANVKWQHLLPNLIIKSSRLLHFGNIAIWLQLLVLLTSNGGNLAHAEGNVGCNYVSTLCLTDSEVCFDDHIFGKCIPTTGVDLEDIERTPLREEDWRMFARMLEEMQGARLGWDHPYVQCRIQGTLFSLQKRKQLPPNLCANLAPAPSELDPTGTLAFVRFTQPDYEERTKHVKRRLLRNSDLQDFFFNRLREQNNGRLDPDVEHFYKNVLNVKLRPSLILDMIENEKNQNGVEQNRNFNKGLPNNFKFTEDEEDETNRAEHESAVRKRAKLFHMLAGTPGDNDEYREQARQTIANLHKITSDREELRMSEPKKEFLVDDKNNYMNVLYSSKRKSSDEPNASYFRENSMNGNYYSNFQQSDPTYVEYGADIDEPVYTDNIDINESGEDESREEGYQRDSLLRNSLTPFEEEAMLANRRMALEINPPKQRRVFTEGGLVYVPDNNGHIEEELQEKKKSKARKILENMLGFTRHERLDVKKPGPLIGPPPSEDLDEIRKINATTGNKEVLPAHIKNSNELQKMKKVVKENSSENQLPNTTDEEYAHVIVKNPIDKWEDGVRIVNELANILHMQGYFTYLTVQLYQVAFRVDSNNPEHKTANEIARIINENRGVKNNLLRRLGVTVMQAGVGKKIKIDGEDVSSTQIRYAINESNPDVTHIMAYMFAGAGAAAAIVILVTLILIKRHDRKRDKLGGLQSGAGGAESCSKDYQDLCRARMAGKGNVAEPVPSGRITTLSKENDRPPSSRSSTSSWSEEPALTNMDISTGHMVLSYMEDHLRNKGRLQREWEALCRYEAEPSARDAAQQPQCSTFNRNGAPLPYDHSRVVLNHLANAEGLDYINASTITDHDPRAPAYVAAQGPLPTTLAHFWQMVWEQGAVVIVSLCRLQENGDIACARYWPEEGAEVYHIYEVHLVSEHIWCDDYLVRSFYLKNLRTSETRTVTQFHFLSWPQNGVPAQAKALLDFRRKVNKSYRGRSCPIVVHGSTGAGRTGAYILLDLVLGRMNKGAREIDIAATLEHLRDQRAGLVATRQQFEFVLMAVAEEVHAILKALPANQSGEKRDSEKDAGATGTLKEESGNEDDADALKNANDNEKSKTTETNKNDSTKAKGATGAGNVNGNGKGNGSATTSEKRKK